MADIRFNTLNKKLIKLKYGTKGVVGDAIDYRILVDKVEDIKNIEYCYVGMLFSTADDEKTVYKVTKVDESAGRFCQALEWVKIGTTNVSIKVAGGAIDGTGIWENDEIPAGTSTEEILQKLLCRELYPNTASLPSITVKTVGTAPSSIVKIGSSVNINAFTAVTTNGSFNASYNNISQPNTGSEWSNIKYSTSKTGFTNYITVTDSESSVTSQNAITVSLGTNNVTCTVNGNYSAPSATPITNIGNNATDAKYSFTAGSDSNSETITVVGVYPLYFDTNTSLTISDKYTKIINSNKVEIDFESEMNNSDDKYRMMFACPTSHTISKVEIYNGLAKEYQEQTLANFFEDKESDIEVEGMKYHIYTRTKSENKIGASTYRFTLNKKTSE